MSFEEFVKELIGSIKLENLFTDEIEAFWEEYELEVIK